MSEGPAIVAVQLSKFSGEEGNAEIPGVLESISCISSVWRLQNVSAMLQDMIKSDYEVSGSYRLVTLCVS